MIDGRVVLPETRQTLQTHYPEAFRNPAYLRLLGYVFFSCRFAENCPGHVLLDQSALAWAEGKSNLVATRNYVGEPFLRAYLHDVHGRSFDDMGFKRGKERVWQATGPAAISQALKHELTTSRRERERHGVRLETGRRVDLRSPSETARWTAARKHRNAALLAQAALPGSVTEALSWLNVQPTSALRRVLRANLDEARRVIGPETLMPAQHQRANLRRLLAIEHLQVPTYQQSDAGSCPLIRPAEPAYRQLHPLVERQLYQHLHHFELPPLLHLAAEAWQDEELTSFLNPRPFRVRTLLDHFFYETGVGRTTDQHRHRFLLETVLRELILGASNRSLFSLLTQGTSTLDGLDEAVATVFLGSAPVRLVVQARERRAACLRPLGLNVREDLLQREWQGWAALLKAVRSFSRRDVQVVIGSRGDLYLHFSDESRAGVRLKQLKQVVRESWGNHVATHP